MSKKLDIFQAAKKGDLERVKECIETEGADVNAAAAKVLVCDLLL